MLSFKIPKKKSKKQNKSSNAFGIVQHSSADMLTIEYLSIVLFAILRIELRLELKTLCAAKLIKKQRFFFLF